MNAQTEIPSTIPRGATPTEIKRILRAAYIAGFRVAEKITRDERERCAKRGRDRALGVGFLLGVAAGVVLAAAVAGWMTP